MNVSFKVVSEVYKNDGGKMYLFNGTKMPAWRFKTQDQRN
jgi:hypothetical protein